MSTRPQFPLWIRSIVFINALAFLDFALLALFIPEQLARWVEIDASTPTALADVRAVYGGMSLATAVLLGYGLRRAAWFAPTLFFVIMTSGGLAFSRLYSIAVSGVPSGLVLAFLAVELVSLACAVLAYRALGSSSARSLLL